MDSDAYFTGAKITGFIAFIVAWIYAIVAYGFFLGLGLGWVPALVFGVVAGLLWPLIALVVLLFAAVLLWALMKH